MEEVDAQMRPSYCRIAMGLKSTVAMDLPATDGFAFSDDVEIISDERGVRIARGEESD